MTNKINYDWINFLSERIKSFNPLDFTPDPTGIAKRTMYFAYHRKLSEVCKKHNISTYHLT